MLSAAEWTVIELSLRVALVATLWTLPVAIALAWLLARRDFIGKSLLDAVVHLPLVLPPVVLGYGLLVLLGRKGPIGSLLNDWFGITLAFTWEGAAIAAGVRACPWRYAPSACRSMPSTVAWSKRHALWVRASSASSPPSLFLLLCLACWPARS